jgi:hypothetical protein
MFLRPLSTIAALLMLGITAQADNLPVVETYDVSKPSGDLGTALINKPGSGLPSTKVRIINFGIEDAEPAHALGHRLGQAGYTQGQAEAEIWRSAWMHYPRDRFFARCFAQEAQQAYLQAVHPH